MATPVGREGVPGISATPADRRIIRIRLRQPIVDYYTGTYNTLLSVVQGVVLAALLTGNPNLWSKVASGDLAVIAKGVGTLLVAAVVWHRYVSHNQFLAWRPGAWDALIPVWLAAPQVLMALSIEKRAVWYCVSGLCVSLAGGIAYQNTILRSKNPRVLATLEDVLEDQPLSARLLHEIQAWQRKARNELYLLAAAFAVVLALLRFLDDRTGNAIGVALVIAGSSWVFHHDLAKIIDKVSEEVAP